MARQTRKPLSPLRVKEANRSLPISLTTDMAPSLGFFLGTVSRLFNFSSSGGACGEQHPSEILPQLWKSFLLLDRTLSTELSWSCYLLMDQS